ncbi:iron-sulfur cluster assembly accessory protein [Candidatus Acetothermia bacterium]|jgi:iron-sulfur cluster assembly accessory protein|nr:iron-sulfur cluster assembly accessory protein [Candidatus Acetothermia bacterium]MCI2432297.1 iron-sulfur cluster assembly accessory protein [Candidatus Acetothermia bacterium]MCI2437422.1 iron-sulfur cluster assembly accessory protein [Candidatus Acetothermia bacterium]
MFTVTEKAAQALSQFLQNEGKGDHGLRVVAQAGGCCGPAYGLFLEKERAPGDLVVEAGSVKIYVDQMSSTLLSEAKLDFTDGPEPAFYIDNPNSPQGGSCGCGSSEGKDSSSNSNGCGCGCGH